MCQDSTYSKLHTVISLEDYYILGISSIEWGEDIHRIRGYYMILLDIIRIYIIYDILPRYYILQYFFHKITVVGSCWISKTPRMSGIDLRL